VPREQRRRCYACIATAVDAGAHPIAYDQVVLERLRDVRLHLTVRWQTADGRVVTFTQLEALRRGCSNYMRLGQ